MYKCLFNSSRDFFTMLSNKRQSDVNIGVDLEKDNFSSFLFMLHSPTYETHHHHIRSPILFGLWIYLPFIIFLPHCLSLTLLLSIPAASYLYLFLFRTLFLNNTGVIQVAVGIIVLFKVFFFMCVCERKKNVYDKDDRKVASLMTIK